MSKVQQVTTIEPTKKELEQISSGYQTLFRYILSDLKQIHGEELNMSEIKPYLLHFENPFPDTPVSIFPSDEVRRQYIDAAFSIFNEGKHDQAKNCFMFLTEVVGDDPNVLLGYGTCLLVERNQEEAKVYFEKAEKLLPGHIQATILKIRSYVELGMKSAASSALQSAIDDAGRQSDQEKLMMLKMVKESLKL